MTRKFQVILKEYFDENFVFAARFVTDVRLTFFERFYWISWIITSIVTCCLAAVLMHAQWDRNPMVIVYGSRFMPVTTVPFPAVTICPLVKSRAGRFNLSETYERNGSTSSRENLRTLAHVCPMSSYWSPFESSRYESIVSTLRELAVPMDDFMNMCLWRLKRIPCEHLFTRVLLDEGICFTFNGLSVKEIYREEMISDDFMNFTTLVDTNTSWTLEKGYPEHAGLHAFPRRPLSSGIRSGFFALIKFKRDDSDISCNGPYSGFKVAIHAPNELPLMNLWYYRIGPSSGICLNVKPEVFRISNKLYNLSPQRRQCYFANERYLRYFSEYSQQNCFQECLSNYTLNRCGCVQFSMPRTSGMRVCDASKIGCYRTVYDTLMDLAIRSMMTGKYTLDCRCFPGCNSIRYNAESHQVGFNFSSMLANVNAFHRISYDEDYDPAAMLISFKERNYLPLWRRAMMSSTDAIAKLGGLFALLLGASAMSLGELLYFCCVRPLRRERRGIIKIVDPR